MRETDFWDMHPETYNAVYAGWTQREVRAGRMREEDMILRPAQQLARDRAAAATLNALFNPARPA